MTRAGTKKSQQANITGKLPNPPLENTASGIFQKTIQSACSIIKGNFKTSIMFSALAYLLIFPDNIYFLSIPARLNISSISSEILENFGPTYKKLMFSM